MNRDILYLRHILDATRKIEAYASVGREVFLRETQWQDAIVRQLEIIGEATKQISAKFREQYSDIPWKRIAGLRDVLIHDYMGVDLNAVWEITQQNIPQLKSHIDAILSKCPQ